jgi:hypothetical protein
LSRILFRIGWVVLDSGRRKGKGKSFLQRPLTYLPTYPAKIENASSSTARKHYLRKYVKVNKFIINKEDLFIDMLLVNNIIIVNIAGNFTPFINK